MPGWACATGDVRGPLGRCVTQPRTAAAVGTSCALRAPQSHHRHHQTAWRRHIFHAHSACPPSDSCTKPHAPAFLPHISVALSPALRLPLPRLASHCRASISTMTRAMEMPLMRAATRGRSTNTQARTQARTRRPAPCGLKELECMVGRAATNTVGGAVGWWSC